MNAILLALIAQVVVDMTPTQALDALPCDADFTEAIQGHLWSRLDETDPADPNRFYKAPVVDLGLARCEAYKVSDTLHLAGARIHCAPGVSIVWTTTVAVGLYAHSADGNGKIGTSHGISGAGAGFGGFENWISGCRLEGPTYVGNGIAIESARRLTLQDVKIERWGAGVNLDCGIGRTPTSNCNNSVLEHVEVTYVEGDALHVAGPDSNAHLVYDFQATYYGGWCIFSSGFLGSTYVNAGCHMLLPGSPGAVTSDNEANARAKFIGLYVEGPQLVDAPPPAVVWPDQGGAYSARTVTIGAASSGPRKSVPAIGDLAWEEDWPLGPAAGGITTMWRGTADATQAGTLYMRHDDRPGRGYYEIVLNALGAYSLRYTDKTHAQPGLLWAPTGYLEGPTAMRRLYGAGAPTLAPGDYALGSTYQRTDPVAGEPTEWIVVTSTAGPGQEWVPR